jgi:LETM1 and EF-hand domain-containing protein 1
VDSLTIPELQTAAQARGIRIVGASPARMRSELSQWIHLHLDKQIPSSLLILSRVFVISERIPRDEEEALQGNAQALQATLSSLPDYVVNEAALNVAEAEGTATIKQKLAFIKDQEELIGDELEQAEVCIAIV